VSEQTPPSPEHFFQTVNAYQRTAAIKAAIELDLFTAVAEGARAPRDLARRCQASERGLRILCDYLVVIGFLTKDEGGYGLTHDSAVFLDRRSPAYMGGATEFLLSDMLTGGFSDLAAVVRKGGTVMNEEGGTVSPENPVWVKFARAMAPMMRMPAQAMAETAAEPGRPQKVLDIAAGHGVFGIAFAQANPQARVVALDWPSVLEVAKENARQAGVAERFSTLEGSALELDYGADYDVILLTNFLHHFDPETCESILRKVRAALKEDGRVLTLEFVPNDDRVSPPIPASFSLQMLGGTESGDAYTFGELERMFRNAGFSRNELHELPASPQRLIVSYK
jgi:ubiquinone/menaquinone biosynthesis C-methylase UbiE